MSEHPPSGGARRAAKPRRADRRRAAKQSRQPEQPVRSRLTVPGGSRTVVRGRSRLSATLVLLALAAACVGLTFGSGAQGRPRAIQVGDLVDHTVVACPSASAPADVTSTYSAGVLGEPGLGTGGSVRQGPVADAGSELPVTRGRLVDLTGVSSAAVVSASGQLAAGLFGFRADTSSRTDTLAATPCAAPRAQWWFSGVGAGLDHSSELVLANVDSGPAVLDLTLLGPNGLVDTVKSRGITLAPGDEQRIPLSTIAAEPGDLTLGVRTSRGRVLASVTDGFAAQAGTAPGREWLSGDADPARVVRIAGLPDKADQHTLVIANPGNSEALVDVQVAGANGRFVPSGLDTQTVAPDSVTEVDLDKSIGAREAVALRLTASSPVLGTVRSVVGTDTTDAPAVLPLSGPAAAPVLPGSATSVQVTSERRPAVVSVTAYDKRGTKVDSAKVRVPATGTAAWSPHGPKIAYVVVTPLSGSVHGAVVSRGKGVTAYPLDTLPIRLEQPLVTPSIG